MRTSEPGAYCYSSPEPRLCGPPARSDQAFLVFAYESRLTVELPCPTITRRGPPVLVSPNQPRRGVEWFRIGGAGRRVSAV